MPFNDPIVADEDLVRTAIRSPNFAPGVAGWRIAADGTAQFAGAVFYIGATMITLSASGVWCIGNADGSYARLYHDAGQGGLDLNPADIVGHVLTVASLRAAAAAAPGVPTLTISSPSTDGGNQASITLTGENDAGSPTSIALAADSASLPKPAWTSVTFDHNWADWGGGYDTCQYTRHADGTVRLKGTANGNAKTDNHIFTLPAGYRPAAFQIFPVMANGAIGSIEIYSTGQVILYTGVAGYLCLDGVTFLAA